MKAQSIISPSIQRILRISVLIDIVILIFIIFLDFIGWIFDIPFLKSFDVNWIPMKPVTAICFLLSTFALIILAFDSVKKSLNPIIIISGILINMVGLLTIICYVGSYISGEEISITGSPFFNLLISPAWRMALVTAINFLFIGTILIILSRRNRRAISFAHVLIFIPLMLSYLVVLSYILGIYHVHEIQAVPVALNTGIAFCSLCFALFWIHPDSWLMKIFTGQYAGSVMARRLLPGTFILPVVIGWLRIYGERIGLFESEIGVVLVALTYTLCFLWLVWVAAGSVNKTDVALRLSEKRFSTTLASIGDAVIATDVEGNITFLNRVCEELTGWKYKEAINRPVQEVFHIINENTRQEVDSPVQLVLEKGKIVGLANHTILVRKDGTEIPIDDSGAPINGKNGDIEGVVLVFRNITERKKSEKLIRDSEATLHLAQQTANAGTWDWDITKGILKWTPELFKVFGLDPDKDSSNFETWDRILHPDDKADAYEMIETSLKEHTPLDNTYRIIKPDGIIQWIRITGEGTYDEEGSPVRMIGICQDVSENKKMQEQIQHEAQRALMLSNLSKMFTEVGFNLPDIFNTITSLVAEYIGEACIITRLSGDEKFLIPTAFYHPDPEVRALFLTVFPQTPIRVGEGYMGQVAITGKSILITGLSREQLKASIKPEFWPFLERFGLYDYLIVPLKAEGRVIGTIGVMRLKPGHSYNAEDQAFLEVIAGRMAMAITNIQLYEAIKQSRNELELKVKERTSALNRTMTELSNERKRFRDVLDMLPSFVTLMNRDYQFTFTNREFIERFGDSIGKRCYEHFFNRNEPCEYCHTDEVLNNGSCAFCEWKGPDGLTYDVAEIPFTDTDGSKLVLKIGSDITKVKQAEDDRIGREVAESANHAKSEFLANISHEIRTPMNSIIGFSDLLSSTIKDEKQLSQIKAIQVSSKNLMTLINDILDLSKIEAGKMKIQPEPVNFHKLISEVENVIIHRAQEKGIGFFIETEKDVPGTLLVDETRLRQVLFNLLENAVKFTDQGHVILTIDRLLKKDEKIDLVISIEDTGIGIPEDQQEMVFQAFSRQKGLAEKKYGGTGLGLTITRRLVELMGGSVNLTSEPGKGSIFTVILPDIPVVHDAGTVQREKIFDFRTIRFKKSRILIADDNFENRKLLIDLLSSSPLELIEAANGKEALELATKYLPDLILMDLRMPEMSGYEATKILKSQESTKAIPIVALSASPKIVFNGQSSKDIFDDFIMKPINLADLAEHLKKYLPHKVEEFSQQELSVKPVQNLTGKQKQQLKELIETLEIEFLPVYRKAMAKQVISQINLFGQNLMILGEKSGSGLLMNYGKDICTNAENFDVEHLMEKLRLFPEIIDRLKKSNES